jgi:hypothetical protein
MFLFVAVASFTLSASAESPGDNARPASINTSSPALNDPVLTSVLATSSDLPRGPQELLQDYEAEMGAITQKFSANMSAIAQAVQSGQLSSDDAQKISADQYDMAQMQFELLSTWRDMLAQDLANYSKLQSKPALKQESDDIVMAALPFSSFELDPSLAKFLNLSQQQAQQIQQLMTEEQRNLQPLMTQLRTTKEKLLVATGADERNEKEIKALAAAEAKVLSKLIVANSHMQAQLYKFLTPEQQKKLDDFKRSAEIAMVAGD